jgi:homoserine dehydrogenase
MSTSHARPLTIGLIGWGTVGSALGRLLTEGPLALELVRLAVRDPHRHRSSPLPDVSLGTPEEIAAAGDCQVVVELAGGADVALPWAERALSRGAAYVTANKALLATHGDRLARIAGEHSGAALLASASVGGGTPMIETVEHLAATGSITRLRGLLNATTTFILSAMAQGRSYDEALAAAQRAGYAEADPSFDVDGRDAAQKLAILASVAWGTWRAEREVQTQGIVGLAVEPGRTVRLLAEADREEMHVRPTELLPGTALASASGIESVLEVEVAGAGTFRVSGAGAGGRATAGAVYADLGRMVAGERPILFAPRQGAA